MKRSKSMVKAQTKKQGININEEMVRKKNLLKHGEDKLIECGAKKEKNIEFLIV